MVKMRYIHKKGSAYPREIRELVISEYYRGVSRDKLAMKYNIENATVISHWIRNFEERNLSKKVNSMSRNKRNLTDNEQFLESEIHRLKRELSQKNKLLSQESQRAEKADLKSELLNMMIDIAETDLNICIRKKSGPKQ